MTFVFDKLSDLSHWSVESHKLYVLQENLDPSFDSTLL